MSGPFDCPYPSTIVTFSRLSRHYHQPTPIYMVILEFLQTITNFATQIYDMLLMLVL